MATESEKLTKLRSVARRQFTKIANVLEAQSQDGESKHDAAVIKVNLIRLEEFYVDLQKLDEKIKTYYTNWEEVQRQSTVRHVAWKMNAPSAAWWGGYWERLIRIMKDLLKRILGKATVTFDELQTIICDCEATMNGRPLTYVCDDKGESLEPLTPAYFIQPIPNSEVPDIDVIDATNLNNRLQYLQALREQFRQRFKSEYLSFLVQKGKEKKDCLAVGDIVLIETEEKRVKWPLGLVLELIEGKDGIERTARVKTSSGVKVRPVQRLYKLEVSTTSFSTQRQETPTATPAERLVDTEPRRDYSDAETVSNPQPQITRCGRKVNLPSKYKLYV